MNKNTLGFSVTALIVATLAIGIVGLLIWRVWTTAQPSQPAPSATSVGQEKQEPKDPNEGYVVLDNWGVRFKPVDGLHALQHFKPSDVPGDSLTFTTTQLAQMSPGCNPASKNIILGLLTRTSSQQAVYGEVIAKINDFYYQYRGPQATCGADSSLESTTLQLLIESLKSLEQAR